MRRSILLLATVLSTTTASLIPDLLRSFEDLQDVQKRCANPCGYYGQVCCGSGEACYTDSNDQAQCTAAPQATQVATLWTVSIQYWTTTYLQTDLQTITQTLSTLLPSETSSCKYSEGQTPCGNVCCLSGQYCQSSGQCVAVGGGSSGYYSNLYTVTTIITNTAVSANQTNNQHSSHSNPDRHRDRQLRHPQLCLRHHHPRPRHRQRILFFRRPFRRCHRRYRDRRDCRRNPPPPLLPLLLRQRTPRRDSRHLRLWRAEEASRDRSRGSVRIAASS